VKRTYQFREQHERLLEDVEALKVAIAGPQSTMPEIARAALSQLLARYRAHLLVEATKFYPPVLKSKDAALVALAQRFQIEMTLFRGEFERYARRWPNGQGIRCNIVRFVADTEAILVTFVDIIWRVNDELYAAVDRVPPATPT
jgi:hypothetical protein